MKLKRAFRLPNAQRAPCRIDSTRHQLHQYNWYWHNSFAMRPQWSLTLSSSEYFFKVEPRQWGGSITPPSAQCTSNFCLSLLLHIQVFFLLFQTMIPTPPPPPPPSSPSFPHIHTVPACRLCLPLFHELGPFFPLQWPRSEAAGLNLVQLMIKSAGLTSASDRPIHPTDTPPLPHAGRLNNLCRISNMKKDLLTLRSPSAPYLSRLLRWVRPPQTIWCVGVSLQTPSFFFFFFYRLHPVGFWQFWLL